jgi:8-oxo-dGTP diphosphatase
LKRAQAPGIHVLVGVIEDARGRVLVNRRVAGTHMAGFWEFPGGKRQADESRIDALRRELREELGIDVQSAKPYLEIEHDYGDRHVLLDVWTVTAYEGEPEPVERQELRWVEVAGLDDIGLLPADRPLVEALWAARDDSA